MEVEGSEVLLSSHTLKPAGVATHGPKVDAQKESGLSQQREAPESSSACRLTSISKETD